MQPARLPLLAALFCLTSQAATFEAQQERIDRKQAQLDQACEAAREVKLEPIRARAFEECMNSRRNTDDAESCSRKTSGANANRIDGAPRFYDLPACEEAFEHRKAHPRNT